MNNLQTIIFVSVAFRELKPPYPHRGATPFDRKRKEQNENATPVLLRTTAANRSSSPSRALSKAACLKRAGKNTYIMKVRKRFLHKIPSSTGKRE
jgi:hypothetical protein